MAGCNIVGCQQSLGDTEATCRPVSHTLHYCDRAYDYGSKEYCQELKPKILADLPGQGTILEAAGTANEHFHIQFHAPGENCRNEILCGGAGEPACQTCRWVRVPNPLQPPAGARTMMVRGILQQLVCQ